eukprot:1411115-Amphidinium_carterae.1
MQGRWQAHVRRACWMVILAVKASRWFFDVLLSVCETTKTTGRRAWLAGPAFSYQCSWDFSQKEPYCGLGSSGP